MNNFSGINNVIDYLIDREQAKFDQTMGLLGGVSTFRYTSEYLEEHFNDIQNDSLHCFRQSLAYLLCLFYRDKHQNTANKILDAFFESGQEKDKESADFGELFWFQEEKHIRDRNGNFFNAASLMIVRKVFSEKLTAEQIEKLDESLTLLCPVFVQERAQTVWTYVNPSLGKFAMCALLAEHFKMESYEQDRQKFIEYANFLLGTGVNETLSTTYYCVDIAILLMCLLSSQDEIFLEESQKLLTELFLKQTMFFKERFPAPFRRGYNGCYRVLRQDAIAWLMGWIHEVEFEDDDYLYLTLAPLIALATEKFPEVFDSAESQNMPRTLITKVHKNCEAYSYLAKDFLVGSFNFYPPETTAWQTVGVSGSGWQDGLVYLTFSNQEETSCILRLEAVDENNTFKCHPYEGEFKFDKIDRLYPHLSFPPEPKVRCTQDGSSLLCLYKIDKVDAVLKSFGFNLHFSRFNGKVFDLQGNEVGTSDHCGPVIIQVADSMIYLHPLTRVDMGNSDLLHGAFFEPQFKIEAKDDMLDLKMYNYDGKAKRFTQNHISGGFFLHVASNMSLSEFIASLKDITIEERWIAEGITAHVDQRDSLRMVSVSGLGKDLSLGWEHYTEEQRKKL
jgi:hypothetical protein